MHAKKSSKALANFKAAVLHTVDFFDLRDKRNDALKEAAAALAALEAMVESGTATRKDIEAAEVGYEAKVAELIDLSTKTSKACGDLMTECYTAVLAGTNLEDMAKA
jgi:diphthamide biosynthesis methyltransferase